MRNLINSYANEVTKVFRIENEEREEILQIQKKIKKNKELYQIADEIEEDVVTI